MKILTKNVLSISILGVLSIFTLRAQTVTVLEDFGENTPGMPPGTTTNGYSPSLCSFDGGAVFCNTNIALFTVYGGRSAAGNVVISQYTATGPNDPYVTVGTHSMAITFYEDAVGDSFGNDFQIVLNDTNSFLVEQAAASGQIGRYILRYDVIFQNPSQYNYFNQAVHIGMDQDYLRVGGATPIISGGVTNALGVYSCALELPALGLPAPGSEDVQLYFTDDFTTTQSEPFGWGPGQTNCTIYIGNVRLVDTYASTSTIPVIYPLISFKNGIGAATNLYPTVTTYYGNRVTPRAHLSLYTTNGLYNPATNGIPDVTTTPGQLAFLHWIPNPYDTDFAVTESDGCALQVSNYDTGTAFNGWGADFQISFAGTKLAQVLSQGWPLPQVAHYTLRWDTTTPELWAIADGNYFNLDYSTGAASLIISQSRRVSAGQTGLQRSTYSLTLDQIAAWGESPPVGGYPAIIVFSDASDMAGPLFYYFDNFELIDTAPVVPKITSSQYNPTTHQFALTWTSETGGSYTVQSSASLQSSFTSLVTGIPSGGNTTTTTVTMPGGNTGFLRILAQ